MTDCHHFSALTKRLEGLLRSRPDIELRVLPEGQLLLHKAMIPNPAATAGLKAAAQTPSPQGYEIYVSCQGGERADEPPSARFEPPAVVATPGAVLALEDGRQEGYWRVLNAAGERVTVRAQVGAQVPQSEVNDLLAAIGAELLP